MSLAVRSDDNPLYLQPAIFLDQRSPFPKDVVEGIVDEYADLVQSLTAPDASDFMLERSYGRILCVRGTLCRVCPSPLMKLVGKKGLKTWQTAEQHLYDFFFCVSKNDSLLQIIRKSEANWIKSAERYIHSMSANLLHEDVPDQIGLLRGIDSIALHLAQRELFHWSGIYGIPPDNAPAVKLRVRLLSLFLVTDRVNFEPSYRAIQSYRETFGIFDRLAYPWWFVDCNLTERQMNWTYRRLGNDTFGWRF
jgi:hypothetical protein